ncbi:MAG: aspartate ammonia-lyase [Paenalcaligenes sp.]
MSDEKNKRIESDTLGEVAIDAMSLYGINSYRGMENFCLGTASIAKHKELVKAFAECKWAAALANHEQGVLSSECCTVIVQACQEMIAGKLDSELIVELLEGSGGTSTNMNINEVLANRAQQLLGHKAGSYDAVHPNDQLNLSQSTNDVYPSALKLAVYRMIPALVAEIDQLVQSLKTKESEFFPVVTLGRTCLQDAQPMRMGQRFGGYAASLARASQRLSVFMPELTTLPLGGTAIGTGFGARDGYKSVVFEQLSEIVGFTVQADDQPFDAMQSLDSFAVLSSYLKVLAAQLAKIANDLMILSSGPVGGLGEIVLPSVQAGSSIMPGKINPVQPISMCQIAFIVSGNDSSIGQAVQAGQLEINHYEPIVADRLFESLRLLTRGIHLFNYKCISGLKINKEKTFINIKNSSAIATALVPVFGYKKVSGMVKKSIENNMTLIEYLNENKIISEEEAVNILEKHSLVIKE